MQLKNIILLFCFICLPFSAMASNNNSNNEIKNNIEQMVSSWNRGDINTFITSYENSNSTIYIASNVIHGYKNILQRYVTHYPDRSAMGTLSVSQLEIKILSPQYAIVIGHWNLIRKNGNNLHGIFTLLYEKTAVGWKIILDHTS